MKKRIFDPSSRDIQIVGELDLEKVKSLVGVQFPEATVYIYPGAIKHIKKKHADIFETHYFFIPEIIVAPDYIGKNPKEPASIELYKRLNPTLLVAVKLSPKGYLHLSSFYDLDNAEHKIQKRLRTGRIVPYK
ncbi:PBECR2 nuclease fold domain-containing protein [Heliorestis convoluta]|uniref:Phage-Barnase-EndoU-ColicinE5/D-RelE like nuclease 3 domain-containing protein n=1 Tax=Heliorestis convoluta TaxID=356322 RepID=A0A5Q2MYB1_9FIRM|nr:hypothetical protein [Heliorestis convoluta]QGG46329.1 hypothetical protein FTV88_0150 [Heliorestis convoluta]